MKQVTVSFTGTELFQALVKAFPNRFSHAGYPEGIYKAKTSLKLISNGTVEKDATIVIVSEIPDNI